jgi:hypothetical protein
MRRFTIVAVSSLMLGFLGSPVAYPQIPLGKDLVLAVSAPDVLVEYSPQPVCDAVGVCGMFWNDSHTSEGSATDILAAVLSPQGEVLAQPRILSTVDVVTGPIAVGLDRGFAVLWDARSASGQTSPVLQYYDESLSPLGSAVTLPLIRGAGFGNPMSYDGLTTIVRTPSGFALYGVAADRPSLADGVFVFFIDRDGKQTHPRLRINDNIAPPVSPASFSGLAVQPDGGLVAVYWGGDAAFPNVYMRRLTADGKLLGPERLVNPERHSSQAEPVVASTPDGSFLVVWQRSPAPDTTHDILARRFSAKGQPLGKPFQVNNIHQLDQRRPAITADAQGNYFIVWQSFIPPYNWDIKGRLFRSNGTPVAGEIRLNEVRQLEQYFPQVTFSPAGTIIAGWESGSLRQRGNEEFVPVARMFSVVPLPTSTDGQEKRP